MLEKFLFGLIYKNCGLTYCPDKSQPSPRECYNIFFHNGKFYERKRYDVWFGVDFHSGMFNIDIEVLKSTPVSIEYIISKYKNNQLYISWHGMAYDTLSEVFWNYFLRQRYRASAFIFKKIYWITNYRKLDKYNSLRLNKFIHKRNFDNFTIRELISELSNGRFYELSSYDEIKKIEDRIGNHLHTLEIHGNLKKNGEKYRLGLAPVQPGVQLGNISLFNKIF